MHALSSINSKHNHKIHRQITHKSHYDYHLNIFIFLFIAFSTHYFDIINHNNFIDQPMNRFRPYLNRFVKQKELDITDIYHDHNMK